MTKKTIRITSWILWIFLMGFSVYGHMWGAASLMIAAGIMLHVLSTYGE